MKRPMGKRTRHMFKPYFLTVPRVSIEGRVYEIKLRISQVIIRDVGKAKYSGTKVIDAVVEVGEIERGSIDAEEDSSEAKDDD